MTTFLPACFPACRPMLLLPASPKMPQAEQLSIFMRTVEGLPNMEAVENFLNGFQ